MIARWSIKILLSVIVRLKAVVWRMVGTVGMSSVGSVVGVATCGGTTKGGSFVVLVDGPPRVAMDLSKDGENTLMSSVACRHLSGLVKGLV